MLCLRKCVQALKNVGWSQYYFVGVVDVRVFLQTIYDSYFIGFYNAIFTSLPCMMMALFEQVSDRQLDFHTLYTLQLLQCNSYGRKESKLIS